jgi:hypothetical protein
MVVVKMRVHITFLLPGITMRQVNKITLKNQKSAKSVSFFLRFNYLGNE